MPVFEGALDQGCEPPAPLHCLTPGYRPAYRKSRPRRTLHRLTCGLLVHGNRPILAEDFHVICDIDRTCIQLLSGSGRPALAGPPAGPARAGVPARLWHERPGNEPPGPG